MTYRWIPVTERLPTEDDGVVAVVLDDGSILTAWAVYWHGASDKFAQWVQCRWRTSNALV